MSATWWYDAAGNRTKTETTVLGSAYVVASQYDTLNRTVEEDISSGGSLLATKRMGYDAAGNRVLLEADAAGGAGTELSMGSVFDPLNRVTAVMSAGKTTTYSYDTACLCGSKSNPVSIRYANGVETRMKYDAANRLLSVRHLRGPVTLGFSEYEYDSDGNRTSMRDVLGEHAYGYDPVSRLTSVDHPSWPDQGYGYDGAGNRKTMTEAGTPPRVYNYNNLNELSSVTQGSQTTEYGYDFRGNVWKRTVQGSLDKNTTYTFDGANRLTQVVGPSGTVWYGYDSSGERVAETGPGGVATWYVLDGLSPLLEMGSDRKATAVIVPGISRTRLDTPEPLKEFFLHDGLGSVVMLTDVLGNPTQEYLYDVFGSVRNVVKDPFNRYRFVGLAHDDMTSLIYMNARWYDPAVGRFLSRDPAEWKPEDSAPPSPYSYAESNPATLKDKCGLWTYKEDVGPVPGLEGALTALEDCLNAGVMASISLVVTGGSEPDEHAPGGDHPTGNAVDIGFGSNPSLRSMKIMFASCAGQAGFRHGMEEGTSTCLPRHPPHFHLSAIGRTPPEGCEELIGSGSSAGSESVEPQGAGR